LERETASLSFLIMAIAVHKIPTYSLTQDSVSPMLTQDSFWRNQPMNLALRLSDVARRYRDKPAIIFENHVYTFHELDKTVEHFAAALDSMGLKVGDRVAVQLSKRMEFVFLELAIQSVGGIVIPLNSEYKAQEIEYFLTDSGSAFYITDYERFSQSQTELIKLHKLKTVLIDSDQGSGVLSLADELKTTTPTYARSYPTGGGDVAVTCYTSGTTGRSKGAMITHRNLISNMMSLHKVWDWTDQDVLLHVLPLFHVHGLFVALHGALNAGATIIMHKKFDPLRTWETIEKEKCTMLMGVPTMYQRLMAQWDLMGSSPDLQSMRLFISGSAPLLETQFNRFEQQTGFRILERYGMTETGMVTSNTLDPSGRRPKSVGYPLPGVEIRVVSPSGQDVTPGEVGEVWMRGENVFKGYWQMPQKTEESFHEGWFKSGDLGYQDPDDDARLYLVGRAKELIITGGYNVYPKEVEDVLTSHNAIKEAAVLGLPDEDYGEKVTAIVVSNENNTTPSPESIISYCKSRLAGYKCPKTVLFVDDLPRNAMGKLQKNVLTERFGVDPSSRNRSTS
jgi:malonyl-CoA/methylmalonyl-CoA synthetase